MDITALYKSILESMNVVADEDGMLSLETSTLSPITVGDKRLALPTRSVLADGDFSKIVVFHPLSEDVTKSESAVLQRIRKILSLRLMQSLQYLSTELLSIAATPATHGSLTPTQHKLLLKPLAKADSSTVDQLSDIMDRLSLTGSQKLINFYLKRGGKLDNKGYSRAAIVSFPMLQELEKPDRKVYGVTVKVENLKVIKALFNIIVPGHAVTETYSFGSNSKVAPYFHAMLGAYAKVAKQINAVAADFKEVLSAYDSIIIDTSWVEFAEDLTPYNNKLEPMEGNMGTIVSEEAQETISKSKGINIDDVVSGNEIIAEQRPAPTYTPAIAAPSPVVPVPAPATPAKTSNVEPGKLDFAAMAQQRYDAAMQQQQQQLLLMQQQQQMMQAYAQRPMFPTVGNTYPVQPAGHLQPQGGLAPQFPAAGYGAGNGSANHVRGNTPSFQTYGAPLQAPQVAYSGVQYPQPVMYNRPLI